MIQDIQKYMFKEIDQSVVEVLEKGIQRIEELKVQVSKALENERGIFNKREDAGAIPLELREHKKVIRSLSRKMGYLTLKKRQYQTLKKTLKEEPSPTQFFYTGD